MVNIDYNNMSFMPELWWRGNVLPGDWTCEASITNRALITGQHTKQLGFGIGCFTVPDYTQFWSYNTPSMREDAILLWVSRHSLLQQKGNHSDLDTVTDFYVTGHGHGYFRSALKLGNLVFTNNLVITHQAATYVYKGSVAANVTLPNPAAVDVWGKLEFENIEISIRNMGSNILVFDKDIKLDAGETLKQLNYQAPDNIIKIKCVAGEWIKIA
jgi:hypothetical protein